MDTMTKTARTEAMRRFGRNFIIPLLLLLILAGSSFCSGFGYSRIRLVREWVVENASGISIDLDGALSANTSNQRIESIATEPEMNVTEQEDVAWVRYRGLQKTAISRSRRPL